MRRQFLGLILFAIATTVSVPALAQTVTVHFTGVVDTVLDQLNKTHVTPGTLFRGQYTFDISTPDRDGDPTLGRYVHDSFSVTVGNFTVATRSGEIFVANAHPDGLDAYGVRGDNFAFCGPQDKVFIMLGDNTSSAFNSDALPPNPPDISQFNARDFLIDFRCDFSGDIRIDGTITAIADTNSPQELLWNVCSEITQLISLTLPPNKFAAVVSLLALQAEVLNALRAVEINNDSAAIIYLKYFKIQVALQSGKHLTKDQANSLISQADNIIVWIPGSVN